MRNPSAELSEQLQAALAPQYRLERELGRGGMGVVFLAVDTALDRPVAVKVVHPELAVHDAIARRFLAEARLIARLRHPNIVAVHAAGNAGGLLYYVMDQVPGESLRQRLQREGRLPVAEAARITADLAAALDAAARAGIIHRDVKPENVLLETGTGRAMLADFGIARAMIAAGDAAGDGPTTGRGVAVGTPAYMSPEQAAGEAIDCRSDVYALGVVAYEMLAGRPPFEGPGSVVVSKHLAERPAPIARHRPDCPAPIAAAVMRALEKQPADRWQTGEEFREALAGERAVPATRGLRRRRAVTAGAALVLALLAGGVGVARRGPEGPPPGVNPRHSILVLPFTNVRESRDAAWLRDASVSMLALNLSQWSDLTVVDHERLHDLLGKHGLRVGDDVGLDMARRLAREAGVWTIVMGEYTQAGDSLHLVARLYDAASGQRLETARADGAPGQDVRPLYDELAARLLDLAGAPEETRAGLAQATTGSLEAFRAYLTGVEHLNRWELAAAERSFRQATAIDTTFGLAYYKLALTRGWIVGADDSVSDRAMVRATAYSGRLPLRDRTLIHAYQAFLAKDFAASRALYQQLIARNGTDTDAWYGLGEAWYHDAPYHDAGRLTAALRAFDRTLALDPEYALAYDHVTDMLGSAARPSSMFALMPNDSFAEAATMDGKPRLDSVTRATAARRARQAVVTLTRGWVAAQPTTARAHGALVSAYLVAGDYAAALGEVDRFRLVAPAQAERPFVEARIRFAAGETERAAATLRAALDSVNPRDFRRSEDTPTVLDDIASAANVFAYQGDLANAARVLDLTDQVRRELFPAMHPTLMMPLNEAWHRAALGDLYAAVGAPAASLRRVWESAAEASRTARPEERKPAAFTGASAAIGLLTGLEGDPSALAELRALTGDTLPREVRALLAISQKDQATARRIMSEPDTGSGGGKAHYPVYRRPLAAQAWFLLGNYQAALAALDGFEPASFSVHGFDPRWGFIGRMRLLKAEAYERLGHLPEARAEYHRALDQWRSADPALQPYIQRALLGLGRVNGVG